MPQCLFGDIQRNSQCLFGAIQIKNDVCLVLQRANFCYVHYRVTTLFVSTDTKQMQCLFGAIQSEGLFGAIQS